MGEKQDLGRFVFGGVLGTLGALFLDPQQGRRRRKELVDRAGALFRQTGARVYDMSQLDDVTLARKVETEGVRDVESLLHLPGTPAPMHQ